MALDDPQPPTVGSDQFWLQWAKDFTEGAASKITAAAEKFTTGLAFFWTVYTAIAVVGVGLSGRQFSVPALIVIFSPVVLIIFAYLAALAALMPPPPLLFDPRVLEEVSRAYTIVVNRISQRLRIAAILTTAAAIFIIAAGLMVAFSVPAKPLQFTAEYIKRESGQQLILIGGHLDKNQQVILQVQPGDQSASPIESIATTSPDGSLEKSVPISGTASNYRVSVKWIRADIQTVMSRDVKADSS